MPHAFPNTPLTLLSRLRNEEDPAGCHVSWKRFLELYHQSLAATAASMFRHHTGGAVPPQEVIEDIVATVVVDFFKRDSFDPKRGRLRTYLRFITNARVVDMLRKEKPLNYVPISDYDDESANPLRAETPEEDQSFRETLFATLIENLREQIPLRHFEIFELVKLKGMSPEKAATELGVQRGVIDNTIYKVMKRLREIATKPEYQEEYNP